MEQKDYRNMIEELLDLDRVEGGSLLQNEDEPAPGRVRERDPRPLAGVEPANDEEGQDDPQAGEEDHHLEGHRHEGG